MYGCSTPGSFAMPACCWKPSSDLVTRQYQRNSQKTRSHSPELRDLPMLYDACHLSLTGVHWSLVGAVCTAAIYTVTGQTRNHGPAVCCCASSQRECSRDHVPDAASVCSYVADVQSALRGVKEVQEGRRQAIQVRAVPWIYLGPFWW
jgi:hypothetical protein